MRNLVLSLSAFFAFVAVGARSAEARICCSRCEIDNPPIECKSGCNLGCRSDQTSSDDEDGAVFTAAAPAASVAATSAGCGDASRARGAVLVEDDARRLCYVASR